MGIQPEVFQRFPEVHHIAGACVQAFPQTTHRSRRWRSRCTDEAHPRSRRPGLSLSARACEKAAWQHGLRRPMAAASEGWAAFASTTAPGTLSLSRRWRPWALVPRSWTMAESLRPLVLLPPPCPAPLARYSFPDLGALWSAATDLCPLRQPFRCAVAAVCGPDSQPASKNRSGAVGGSARWAGYFRASPMEYWQGRCPLTPNHPTHLAWHCQHVSGEGEQDGSRDH